MSKPFHLALRIAVVVSSLFVIASATNLTRVEWANDHRTPPPVAADPAGYDQLSPADKVAVLQRRLNGLRQNEHARTEESAAKLRAEGFLLMSVVLMSFCLGLMAYWRRGLVQRDALTNLPPNAK